ncbi:hypothetical protein Tco_1533024 [Tanacetum coccineum]
MIWLGYRLTKVHGISNNDEHSRWQVKATMDNEVGVTSPESTIQTLPSFEEYTPPVTYPEEVEKTLGTLIEVEPLNETKLEEVGLNCNHNTPLSSREVPSFDKLKPQPQPLPNCPPLEASLGTERGLKPPIKPQSPDSFRMKNVEMTSRFTRDAVTTTPVTGSQQPWRRHTPRLYLMRRSLEVLRKFHWMILRGRFNQLSRVSSPLLSKPGEY